jgi:hypothetical protein
MGISFSAQLRPQSLHFKERFQAKFIHATRRGTAFLAMLALWYRPNSKPLPEAHASAIACRLTKRI